MEEKLLTPEQVAEYVNVAPKTVREWLRASPPKLRGVKVGGKLWRIPRRELERFMNQNLYPDAPTEPWHVERLDLTVELPGGTDGLDLGKMRGPWGGQLQLKDPSGNTFGFAPIYRDIEDNRIHVVAVAWDPARGSVEDAKQALWRALGRPEAASD